MNVSQQSGVHSEVLNIRNLYLQVYAQTLPEDSDKMFTELIQSMERRYAELKELIRTEAKAEVGPAEESSWIKRSWN